MENHNLAFGKTLRKFRTRQNITQEMLGGYAGLDRTYISLLELGHRSPTLDTMVAICAALDVELPDFILEVDTIRKSIE